MAYRDRCERNLPENSVHTIASGGVGFPLLITCPGTCCPNGYLGLQILSFFLVGFSLLTQAASEQQRKAAAAASEAAERAWDVLSLL